MKEDKEFNEDYLEDCYSTILFEEEQFEKEDNIVEKRSWKDYFNLTNVMILLSLLFLVWQVIGIFTATNPVEVRSAMENIANFLAGILCFAIWFGGLAIIVTMVSRR
jgi:hypothetical protein